MDTNGRGAMEGNVDPQGSDLRRLGIQGDRAEGNPARREAAPDRPVSDEHARFSCLARENIIGGGRAGRHCVGLRCLR